MAEKLYSAISGSNTKIRAEQIKAEDAALETLAGELFAIKGQITDIIGGATYKEEAPSDVQMKDLHQHINAQGAAELVVKLASAMSGAVQMYSTLNVDGEATLASATVEDLSADRLVASDGTKGLVSIDLVDWITGTANQVSVSGSAGEVVLSLPQDIHSGATPEFAGVKVTGLTEGRVVFVGAADALVDDGDMTYNSGSNVLTIGGSTFGQNVSIAGNLSVLGTTTTIDTTNLLVKDAKIVISSGSVVDGAGIYLADESAGENIRWSVASGSWIASDAFAADELWALDLTDVFVRANSDHKLVAASASDIGTAVSGALAAGTGVTLSYGADKTTVAIGQAVGTGDSVTFANITDSALTANRIVKTAAASGLLESAAIMDFVTGTVNQVVATAGAFGNVVLSLPQDIHTGASPQFTALNVGTAHDIMDIGGDLYIKSTGGLVLSGADGQYAVSEAGDSALFATNFGASETIVGALNVLKAAATTASAAKSVVELGSAVTAGDSVVGISIAGFTPDNGMVFVNGQLMLSGSAGAKDYSIDSGALKFSFNLESGDVVVAQRA